MHLRLTLALLFLITQSQTSFFLVGACNFELVTSKIYPDELVHGKKKVNPVIAVEKPKAESFEADDESDASIELPTKPYLAEIHSKHSTFISCAGGVISKRHILSLNLCVQEPALDKFEITVDLNDTDVSYDIKGKTVNGIFALYETDTDIEIDEMMGLPKMATSGKPFVLYTIKEGEPLTQGVDLVEMDKCNLVDETKICLNGVPCEVANGSPVVDANNDIVGMYWKPIESARMCLSKKSEPLLDVSIIGEWLQNEINK